MITAEDALHVARDREPLPADDLELSDREKTQLDYVDSAIEYGINTSFNGDVFDTYIPAEFVELSVINALKKRYEDGGWKVGVFPKMEGDQIVSFQLVFAPVSGIALVKKPKEKPPRLMPPVIQVSPTLVNARHRVLVRMPTRGRAIQALEVLEKYRNMAGIPILIEVVVDEDDESMFTAEVLQRLAALDCIVTSGQHTNKIAACNGGRVTDWDILILASDDMVPTVEDYAIHVITDMEQYFPYLDGALHYNDGHQRSNLCTLPIFGRRLYEQFGYIYHPDYKSLFCDREQTDILKAMGRLAYVDKILIEHKHHIWGDGVEKDALYERNDALEGDDRKTFEQRKVLTRPHAQWPFEAPPLWLSVLICTVPARKKQLNWLLDFLYAQIRADAPRQVEVLIDDREGITVGEKRQSLLECSRGHFVAFVDDDDGIAPDYVKRLVTAFAITPDADCASLEGVMTTRGAKPEIFRHSIYFDGWYTKEGIHYRTPNHLSAVKREIALQVGFVSKNVGEDHDYSKRLRPLLKKEVSVGEKPLYFYWFDPLHSVQQRPAGGDV